MALFDFAKISKTIADLGAEIKKLRGEREEFLRRREDLESAPACKSDLLELLDSWVDRRAADFPKRLEAGLTFYKRHPLSTIPKNPKEPAQPLRVLNSALDPNSMATVDGLEGSLFFVLGDQIKAGLRQAVEALDFSDAGPPRSERVELIAAVDKRIDEIDKQERELVDQAEKAGLRL